MPEARDRLSRQEDDLIAAYSRRISRTGDRNTGRSGSIAFILEDGSEEGPVAATPFRWRGRGMVVTPGPIGGRGDARGMVGTPGSIGVTIRRGSAIRHSRNRRISQVTGVENQSPLAARGRGRGRGSALPAWYPRTPLNDITAVMRAIERRRERRRAGEGLETESPALQDRIFHNPSLSTPGVQLEHDTSMISPHPTSLRTPSIGKVPKILLDITHQNGDSACLTPQKKLLNNIDTVEKVVMEELRKLKRTPSAKKAEREKRVRTLMSMR